MNQRFIFTMLFLIVIFIGTIAGYFFVESFLCGRRWSDFETKWDIFTQCRVEIDGKLIPERNVRQF